MCRVFVLTFSIFLFLFSGKADAASLYDTVQRGNKLYWDGKFEEALKTYVDGQIEHADDPNLKYNIASAHYKNKNYEEAIKGYLDVAATAKDVKLHEKSLYGSGNALFRQGKLEEAIEYYKKALEIDPNDQDAKHNLEFAREELKRRINEAKETEKKQQEQKQQEQNQQKEQQNNQSKQQDQNKQQEEKPTQSQQQEQKKEEQQGSSQQEQKQEEQKGQPQQEKDKQQAQTGEQKPEGQQQAQAQSGSPENKQDEKAEEGQAIEQKARPMTKEEADQWLNSIEENRDKFAKKKARESVSGQYRPEKDW
jgi:Ca-activated chloride channel family protein